MSLAHLADCVEPQSTTLQLIGQKHRPSKFGYSHSHGSAPGKRVYTHTSFDRIYPEYLEPYRRKKFRLLEIGLDSGASLTTWLEYFPCAEIYGVDLLQERTQTFGSRRVTTHAGDAGNVTFLADVVRKSGGLFEVIVDDGGHHIADQLASYTFLFEHGLAHGGMYIVEDIETSYYLPGIPLYHTRLRGASGCDTNQKGGKLSTVDAFTRMVDAPINGKFSDDQRVVVGGVDHWVRSVTFAQNLILLRKKNEEDCFAQGPYVWQHKLDTSCPARKQPATPVMEGNPFWAWCVAARGFSSVAKWPVNHG